MIEFIRRCFGTWFYISKNVLFDYAVYVSNVIKVTSIARTGEMVFRLDQFLLVLECRLLNTVKVSSTTRVAEGERKGRREESIGRKENRSSRQHSVGPSGPRLIGSNRVEEDDEEESPPVRSFRVLNFNYFELRSETLGSKRRFICR